MKQAAETERELSFIGVEAKVREQRLSLEGRRGEESEAMELPKERERHRRW